MTGSKNRTLSSRSVAGASWRICWAHLETLLSTWVGWVFAIVAPMVLVALAGQFSGVPAPAKLLMAGIDEEPVGPAMVNLLSESALLIVDTREATVVDPFHVVSTQGYDLLLNFQDTETEGWSLYTAATDARRMFMLEQVASGIQRTVNEHREAAKREFNLATQLEGEAEATLTELTETLRIAAPNADERTEAIRHLEQMGWRLHSNFKPRPEDWSFVELAEGLRQFGALPVSPLYKYYSMAADRSLGRLPTIMTFVLCLLPFFLCAIPMNEAETTKNAALSLVAGRLLSALILTLWAFLAMLIVIESLFELHLKMGISWMVLLVLLAALGNGALGLVIAGSATPVHGVAGTGIYVMAVWFLGASAQNAGAAGPLLLASLAAALPQTHLRPHLEAWSFGAPMAGVDQLAIAWPLAALAGLYGLIAWWVLSRQS